MTSNIELLSNSEFFTIGTNSNLTEILANVVKVGTDTSNVTISIPQDISSSYNLILPVRQGASGESLVYGADGQLKWHDTTVLKQVVSVYGSNLLSSLVSTGTHDNPTYLNNYIASIVPKSNNSKIFVQFKVNYHAALSASNQISFYIKKSYDGNETIFTESLFGPYNAAGGFTGQYISNLIDQSSSTNTITYQLGYKVNGNVSINDVVGILGYDSSYNNSILLQEFEGSGSNATSVWNKGADSNGLYYNDGTVHIGSSKNALGSQNTPGVALELSGNLVGTNAIFSGEVSANVIRANDGYFSSNIYINNKLVLNEDAAGNRTVNTDVIISDASNGLTIKAIGDNGSIILDPSGTGSIQLNGDVQLLGGNITVNGTDGGSMIERLRINSKGAIGINGANYGSSGQVLTSNGQNSTVSWSDKVSGLFYAGSPLDPNILYPSTEPYEVARLDFINGLSLAFQGSYYLDMLFTHTGFRIGATQPNGSGWLQSHQILVLNDAGHWEIYDFGAGNLTVTRLVPYSDDRVKTHEQIFSGETYINYIKQIVPKKYKKYGVILTEEEEKLLEAGGDPFKEKRTGDPVKDSAYNPQIEYGVIAQDIHKISGLEDIVNVGDDKTKWRVDYRSIDTITLGAVKGLIDKVENLESENTIIKNALNQLLSDAGKSTI